MPSSPLNSALNTPRDYNTKKVVALIDEINFPQSPTQKPTNPKTRNEKFAPITPHVSASANPTTPKTRNKKKSPDHL